MTYADAVRAIARQYKQRQTDYIVRERDLLLSDEEFAQSERELRDLQLRQIKGEQPNAAELQAARQKNAQIRKRLQLIPPAPHCLTCGDTGFAHGKYCDCAVALVAASQQSGTGIPLHDFRTVDYSVYGDKADAMRKIFSDVQSVCARYPDNKKRCIVLGGSTGTGKTYLAGCAVQEILSRGLSALALTAFAANDRFLKYHTCFDDGKAEYLDPLLDCAFLVLDDLGTESILKNVTLQYLYQLLNERNASGKLTLITTNLTPNGILSRYGERIYSRLFDKSLAYYSHIQARDLRSAK